MPVRTFSIRRDPWLTALRLTRITILLSFVTRAWIRFVSYIFDPAAGTLTTNAALITSVARGSGPRHMTFDPQFKRAYVICELSSTIVGFDFDSTTGALGPFQTISTLPTPKPSGNTTAEIAVHPSGRFLYGSNRGFNTVAVFSIDPATGSLAVVQQQPTGATPRNFAIDPTGQFCIVAGQDSNDIRLYTIDPATGLLTDTNKKISASAPVCILPLAAAQTEPALRVRWLTSATFELTVNATFGLGPYQLYHSPSQGSAAKWTLFSEGVQGQSHFILTNSAALDFFRAAQLQ